MLAAKSSDEPLGSGSLAKAAKASFQAQLREFVELLELQGRILIPLVLALRIWNTRFSFSFNAGLCSRSPCCLSRSFAFLAHLMSTPAASTSNPVLSSAYFVAEQSEHVHLNREGIASAASKVSLLFSSCALVLLTRLCFVQLHNNLLEKPYTTSDWSLVPLHPIPSLHPAAELLNFIFTVSSLNFSFWSDLPSEKRYGVKWKTGVDGKETLDAEGVAEEKVHTGYWSLISALHRSREEGIDVTNPRWYATAEEEALKRVFRSDQEEEIPLLEERIRVLREVGGVLCEASSFLSLSFPPCSLSTLAEIRWIFRQPPRASKSLGPRPRRARRLSLPLLRRPHYLSSHIIHIS